LDNDKTSKSERIQMQEFLEKQASQFDPYRKLRTQKR